MITSSNDASLLAPRGRARGVANARKRLAAFAQKPTFGGWFLFLLGASFYMSALPGFRPQVVGLSLHPYIAVLAVAALPAMFVRPKVHINNSLGGWGILLVVGVGLSFLVNGEPMDGVGRVAKWGTVAVTFWVATRLVRSEADVRWGAAGLVLGVTAIAVRGMLIHRLDPRYYVDVMRGIGSRNAFSLWTLAPVALAMWFIASSHIKRTWKVLALFGLTTMVVPQVLSLSRSGWLMIVATVAMVLAMRRSFRGVVAVLIVGAVLNYGVQELDFGERVERRFNDLRSGTKSDNLRGGLMVAGATLFFENPAFGVSPTRLSAQLGRALRQGPTDSHNLAIDMLAGMGLVGTLPLLFIGLIMFRRWLTARRMGYGPTRDFASLLPILLALFCMRGMTASGVVYNPAVVIGFALAFGAANLAIARGQAQAKAIRAARKLESSALVATAASAERS